MNRVALLLTITLALGALALLGAGAANAQDAGGQLSRCQQVCTPKAENALRECLATGAAPERCRQRARTALEDCMARCKRAGAVAPDPGATAPRACKVRCELLGQKLLAICLALPSGPDRQQCQRRAAQAVQLCVGMTCPKQTVQPDPQACQVACQKRAREVYQKCIGGSTGATPPKGCEEQARLALKRCLEKNCPQAAVTPPPKASPEPDACRRQCRERVASFMESCQKQPGASPERCKEQGAKKLEACVAACP